MMNNSFVMRKTDQQGLLFETLNIFIGGFGNLFLGCTGIPKSYQ